MEEQYREIKHLNKKRAFQVEKWQEDIDLLELLREILFSWIGINCFLGWIGQIAGISYNKLIFLFLTLLVATVFEGILVLTSPDLHKWIYVGIGGFSSLFFFLPFVWNGLWGLFHDVSKTLAGRGVLFFTKGQENDSAFEQMCALLLLACLIYLLVKFCNAYSSVAISLIMIGMLLLEMRCGNGSSSIWLIVILLWMLLKLVTTMRAYLLLFIPVLTFTLIFGFVAGYSDQDGWRNRWNTFRYGESKEILPEGDLKEARKMQRDDKTMLTLQGEVSGYYYLKGFVGTVYDNNRWIRGNETLDDFEAGILAGNNEFLSWLHDLGASGWNELSTKMQESQDAGESYVAVHNAGASRKYLYFPYELTTGIRQIESEKMGVVSSGESILATGTFGRKEYHFKMIPSLAGIGISASQRNEEEADEYDAYEEYVYRTCLTLPKEVKESLKSLVEANSTLGEGDTMATVAKVRSWLNKHAKYNENPDPIPPNKDFGLWFFNDDPEGFDVQYASAAVMLFRYFGIPSRYVEGYLVENVNQIPASAAHAWPEIFLSGKGWIPVEVLDTYRSRMPSYLPEKGEEIKISDPFYDEKEKEDISQEREEEQKTEEKPDASQTQKEEKQESIGKQEEKDGQSGDAKEQGNQKKDGNQKGNRIFGKYSFGVIGILLIIIVIFIVILLLIYLGFRIRESRTFRRATQGKNPGKCVEMWYQYCIWLIYLLEKDPFVKQDMAKDNRLVTWEQRWMEQHPQVSEEDLHQAGRLRQKAIYRRRGVDLEEAKEAITFFEKEYKYFYKELRGMDRFKVHLGLRPPFLKRIFHR